MSLREMCVGLTAAAVFWWCAAQVGATSELFWGVTFVAFVSSILWWGAARSPRAYWLAPFAPWPLMFFCGVPIASFALALHAALLFAAGIACVPLRPLSGRALAWVAAGCLLAALVSAAARGLGDGQDLEEMRQDYPLRSLESLLAYEKRDGAARRTGSGPMLATHVKATLDEFDNRRDWGRDRMWALQALHLRTHDSFILAQGFGVGRMRRPSRARVDRPPLRDIAFGAAATSGDDGYDIGWNVTFQGPVQEVESLYAANREDFLDGDGIGWIKEPVTQVAGFTSHAFHAPATQRLDDSDSWIVERLELVSLLKFGAPRVYVLDHLPRMDQLSSDHVPTRILDSFEFQALAKLQTQQDVVVEESGGATRMMGSLRAAQKCLDCHSAQRGELLGAFSYVLREGEGGEERGVSDERIATE